MKKKEFVRAVHESADRLIARALKEDLPDVYILRLTSISAFNNDTLRPATHSETLVEITDDSWEWDIRRSGDDTIEMQAMLDAKEMET